jgi:single-strand DNA-binding protein
MINLVVLMGRLTSDVELKTTTNGVSVCSFTVANDVGYGENKKTAFINVVAWRKTAEVVSKYFKKGSMISIEGFIQTRNYEDKNGNKRTAFEVVANNVHFMESKNSNQEGKDPLATFNDSLKNDIDISAEDLPFN